MSDANLDALVAVAEAMAILDAEPVRRRAAVDVPLPMAAGRVLADEIRADRDYPPFDKSLVDGFALRTSDVGGPIVCVGESAAGRAFDGEAAPGECVRTMTGAPLPAWADAVVPVERTRTNGDRVAVEAGHVVRPGANIARRGSEARAGDAVLSSDTPVRGATIATLAQVGAQVIRAFERPTAGILVTGDELIDADQTPVPSQIRDVATPMLMKTLYRLGVEPQWWGRVRDDPVEVRHRIDQLARTADVTFVTGGMSMGRYDFVPGVLRDLGFDFRITKVRIQPGKPFVFAVRKREGKTDYVFGLPGNPVSAYVCTLVLASRLTDRLRGLPRPTDRTILSPLAEPLAKANGPREFYLPAKLEGGRLVPLAWRGSADVFTLAMADALIVREAGEPPRGVGELARAVLMPR